MFLRKVSQLSPSFYKHMSSWEPMRKVCGEVKQLQFFPLMLFLTENRENIFEKTVCFGWKKQASWECFTFAFINCAGIEPKSQYMIYLLKFFLDNLFFIRFYIKYIFLNKRYSQSIKCDDNKNKQFIPRNLTFLSEIKIELNIKEMLSSE